MNVETKTRRKASQDPTNRQRSLRRRIKDFYERFNRADWNECYAMLDPDLTDKQRPDGPMYAQNMQAFKHACGTVSPWHVRVSLHLEASPRQQDQRPFAFAYIVWQDENHGFHMFRERWVFHKGRWYTRVAGLIPTRVQEE